MEEKFSLDRSAIVIKPGVFVKSTGKIYKISQIIDFNEVIGINVNTERAERLLVSDIRQIDPEDPEKYSHIRSAIMDIGDKDWKTVEKRLTAIRPLMKGASRKEIEDHAQNVGVHYTTLYEWMRKFNEAGGAAGLLPRKEGRPKGSRLIDPMAEKIIGEVIQAYYLTPQRPKVEAVVRKVLAECKKKNVNPPSKNTIRNRVAALNEYDRLAMRRGKSVARDKYAPAPGSFESAYPLQIVQIDHTKADIILVDDETRQPIGRPYLTLAIDIYSRMIHGYYLSLEAPSSLSVAMCVACAVMPKDELLIEKGIDAEWNIWGYMDRIHSDNGADFRSEALNRACLIHNIELDFRGTGNTSYGGHIERMIGTVMGDVHLLPGTTFSNVSEREKYDSEKHSSMTFSEFERWLVTYITKVYHKRKHQGIGMSPEAKFTEGIFGEKGVATLPPKPSDPQTVLIDFLPFVRRKIQRHGVSIDKLDYYDSVLQDFIHKIDHHTGRKREYEFKRDPRNIAHIWMSDPDEGVYYKIPLANQAMPAMSLWEYNEIRNRLKNSGVEDPHDEEIITAYEELHTLAQTAAQKTKKARRQQQRKKNLQKDVVQRNDTDDFDANWRAIMAMPDDEDEDDDDIPEFEVD